MKKLFFLQCLIFTFGSISALEPELYNEKKFSNRIIFEEFIKHNNKGYFIADDIETEDALWAFDGEVNSLIKLPKGSTVKNSKSVIVSSQLSEYLLFFSTDSISSGLWRTNGTEKGTSLLMRIPDAYVLYKDKSVIVEKTVFFKIKYANDNIGIGFSDGTIEGTGVLSDTIVSKNLSSLDFFSIDNKLLIVMKDEDKKTQILSYYVNVNRLFKLIDTRNSLKYTQKGEFLLFTKYSDTSRKLNLWVTDGTIGGTYQLTNETNFKYLPIDNPEYAMTFKDKFYFLATNHNNTRQIWETNGRFDGTKKFEINGKNYFGVFLPNDQTDYDKMVIITKEEGKDYRLMRTDGTNNGTVFYNLMEQYDDNSLFNFALAKDRLFYNKISTYRSNKIWMQYYYEDTCRLVVDYSQNSLARRTVSLGQITFNEKCLYTVRLEGSKYSLFSTDGVIGEPNLILEDSAYLAGRIYYSKIIENIIYLMIGGHNYSDLKLSRTDMTKSGSDVIQVDDWTSDEHIDVNSGIIELNGYVYFFASYYKGHRDFQLYRIKSPVISNVKHDIYHLDTSLVYPNPTNGIVNINVDCNSNIMSYSVTNLEGVEILKRQNIGNKNNIKLNLTDYPSGIYLITTVCGSENNTYKIIKQN
ncbi:MAG: T9SS type A sorting domain-containing protein [Chlorobiota bacterium]